MAHQDRGNYAGKHPEKTIDPALRERIEKSVRDGRLDCADAHRAAVDCNVRPYEIGIQADLLELRISTCQLGLFGHSPNQKKSFDPNIVISDAVRNAVLRAQTDGVISCRNAWELAGDLTLSRPDMGSICEKMEIRIKPCQLGTF